MLTGKPVSVGARSEPPGHFLSVDDEGALIATGTGAYRIGQAIVGNDLVQPPVMMQAGMALARSRTPLSD